MSYLKQDKWYLDENTGINIAGRSCSYVFHLISLVYKGQNKLTEEERKKIAKSQFSQI